MITVVGGGFAGVEAAWAAAQRGVKVRLYEMRPVRNTPAHTTDFLAELVCSNSLKSKSPTSPAGQLKAEMQALGSVVLQTAYEHEVPAGQALGVDRDKFGVAITERIASHPLIDLVREEFTPQDLERLLAKNEIVILATGPLTSPEIADWLAKATGRSHLYFYDAVSPTVDAASLDRSIVFAQSRYDKGEGDDYLNCPFNKEEYQAFVRELVAAERAPIHAFEAGGKRDLNSLPPGGGQGGGTETLEDAFLEKIKYFSGCSPIEVIAEKGERSLAFGNFKPVGLTDPRTGRRPWAALQLRPENRECTLYSLVACQTRLKWGEQKRVFGMVPGLQNAEFVRFGVIHRNTYLEAPQTLEPWLELKGHRGLFVAGQLTGVEGYVESAASGLYVGIEAVRRVRGLDPCPPPRPCAYGSLSSHLQDATPREFAPMNINWGLFPEPEVKNPRDKEERRTAKLANAKAAFAEWRTEFDPSPVHA
jgi:methylenetetrahydrofolate--tRNA-(uracil-5-)-methyltransferase